MKKLLIACFFMVFTASLNAQQVNKADTLYRIKTTDTALTNVPLRYQNCRKRSPVLAGVLALWIPTAGQIYNKQYLKAGIIWGVATISVVGLVGTEGDHHFHHNTGSDIFIWIVVANAMYSIVDAPISSIYLNNKYHLGKKRKNFSAVRFSPNIINQGLDNKIAFGASLVIQ